MNSDNMIAITYRGSSKFGFYRKLDSEIEDLEASLAEFNIKLVAYSFKDLRKIVKFPNSNFFYFFTRYGAGAWFWKADIILNALSEYRPDYLLYVDADCVLLSDPRKPALLNLNQNSVALFKQRRNLEGWISHRARRILRLSHQDTKKITLVTAGVVLVRNSKDAIEFFETWRRIMKNPLVLLNPVFECSSTKHRHDQAILSALVGSGAIKSTLMHNGFYSPGTESLDANPTQSWVATGMRTIEANTRSLKTRIRLGGDYYSRILYDLLKTIFLTPIHFVFYCLEKSGHQK